MKQQVLDKGLLEKIENEITKRSRITTFVLVSFTMVSLLAVDYGYMQTAKTQEAEKSLVAAQQQVEAAMEEAKKQAALAVESKIIAEEAAKVAYEELENCRKKK